MSPYLNLQPRTLEQAMNDRQSRADLLNEHADARPATAEEMDSCESAASMIRALHDQLRKWDVDALQDVVHGLDVLAAEAKVAAGRVHDRLPHKESDYD